MVYDPNKHDVSLFGDNRIEAITGTQVGLVKSKVKFEERLCGYHKSGNTFLQNLKKN